MNLALLIEVGQLRLDSGKELSQGPELVFNVNKPKVHREFCHRSARKTRLILSRHEPASPPHRSCGVATPQCNRPLAYSRAGDADFLSTTALSYGPRKRSPLKWIMCEGASATH